MPEYLAPGVYLEEVSYRAKTIEGVSTSTAGFVGPTRYGPTSGPPELLTSLADFERIYGGLDQLSFDDVGDYSTNYLAQGVRSFFEEGGKRLYVTRVYAASAEPVDEAHMAGCAYTDNNFLISPPHDAISLWARFPGVAGNMRLTFIPRLSGNLLVTDPLTSEVNIRRIQVHDTVVLYRSTGFTLHDVARTVTNGEETLQLVGMDGTTITEISSLDPATVKVMLLTVDVAIERPIYRPKRPKERYASAELLQGYAFNPSHGTSLVKYFTHEPISRQLQLTVPFEIDADGIASGAVLAHAILGDAVIDALFDFQQYVDRVTTTPVKQTEMQQVYILKHGSDGNAPGNDEYEGDDSTANKSGFKALEDLEDISIVAAPGYSALADAAEVQAIQANLINHAILMRYRIAVLDSPPKQVLSEVREYRGRVDSDHAALYYPWVTILDPITEEEMNLPPSGFVTGIYARNDVDHGVHKAPANEVVRLAIGFETMLNKGQQDVLNPEGINCFRFFEGRGYRLWGARTISSDPEWKYVNLRRYFAYLERSIEKGTQWAVFENNNDTLWANVRRTIEDFLFNEWKSDHLLGEKPQEAYFIRCDRSTMTQNDLDNGRLICLIGVAPVRPAEFVIFRIGQWTADRRG